MKVIVFSSKDYDKEFFLSENPSHEIVFVKEALSLDTIDKAAGADAIVVFVNDQVSAEVLDALKQSNPNLKGITTRAAGYDNIDLEKAAQLGIKIAHVPEYSPYAIAEHAIAMMLALNRKLLLSSKQVHENNFSLSKLVGFNMKGKVVGIIGTGKTGRVVAKILDGFGCVILAYDIKPDKSLEQFHVQYVDIDTLYSKSDIITIHAPLNKETRYLINNESIEKMKTGVMLINTGRGAILNTRDVIEAVKSGKIGYLGMDVYENEKNLYFEDRSDEQLQDIDFACLLSLKNVLITGHQAFLTTEALQNIAQTTMYNLNCWDKGSRCENEL